MKRSQITQTQMTTAMMIKKRNRRKLAQRAPKIAKMIRKNQRRGRIHQVKIARAIVMESLRKRNQRRKKRKQLANFYQLQVVKN